MSESPVKHRQCLGVRDRVLRNCTIDDLLKKERGEYKPCVKVWCWMTDAQNNNNHIYIYIYDIHL